MPVTLLHLGVKLSGLHDKLHYPILVQFVQPLLQASYLLVSFPRNMRRTRSGAPHIPVVLEVALLGRSACLLYLRGDPRPLLDEKMLDRLQCQDVGVFGVVLLRHCFYSVFHSN